MTRVSYHFVRANNLPKFASILVNFMGKKTLKRRVNDNAPENNSQYTIVYVGNLAPEVTSIDLHRHFRALGAGAIEDVRVQQDKGFSFVRYSTHSSTYGN